MQEGAPMSGTTSQKARILIVEDEALFGRAVAKRLQKAGYDCKHA